MTTQTETLLHIPVEQIAVIDRARKEMGDVSGLAQDMLTMDMMEDGTKVQRGQLQPGIVRRSTPADVEAWGVDPEATPWVLVAGGRRYAAVCLAGFDTYKAVDRGHLPLLLQRIYELHENLFRKNLSWQEEVFLKEEIHNLRKMEAEARGESWSQTDTGKELGGESVATISRDLTLAKQIRENPELATATSKHSAVRMAKYNKAVETRLANVSQTSMLRVKDRLVTADMRDFVRTLETDSIDLMFTDFPFGIEYNFDETDRNKYEDSMETLRDLLTDIIPQMIRVTKPTGWMALMMGSTNYELLRRLVETCCATHFEYFDTTYTQDIAGNWREEISQKCSHLRAHETPCRKLRAEDPEWLWFRPNSRNPSMYPELHAQNQYEKICVVNMGEAVLIKKNLGNVLVHDAVYEDRIHEMQRPHSLCLDVISRLTVGGERVADLCFGSGSALAAAAELERDFIGCDMNPKCLDPAVMWVTEHMPKRG